MNLRFWERVIDIVGEDATERSLWQLLGPLFILSCFALAPRDLPLLFMGAVGLYLSARWQLRGFSYALILLGLVAIAEHLFLTHRHLWQLGLEGALANAFFITALAFEEGSSSFQSLTSQLDARTSTLHHLEEELAKSHDATTQQQIAFQEKIATLQKETEEMRESQSSLLILNEVLRKTAATQRKEKEALEQSLCDKEQTIATLQKEQISPDILESRNRELLQELNAARMEKEQLRLINEALARLHAKESLKVKEALEQVRALTEEMQKRPPPSEVELLYKQLRKQFEEKSELLHQTRSQLFHADTALQALKKAEEQRENLPLREVAAEWTLLEKELFALEKENRELQDLVTLLMEPPSG